MNDVEEMDKVLKGLGLPDDLPEAALADGPRPDRAAVGRIKARTMRLVRTGSTAKAGAPAVGTRAPWFKSPLWWAGTAVVAAGLAALVILGGLGKGVNPPIQPTNHGDKGGKNTPPDSQAQGGQLALSTIRMVDAQNGWAIRYGETSGNLLRTTDGGRTWTDVTPPGGSGDLGFGALLQPLGPAGLWVATGGTAGNGVASSVTIYRTTDGGANWQSTRVTTRYTNGAPVHPVSWSFTPGAGDPMPMTVTRVWLMVSPEHTMNSEPGELLVTSDSGQTWSEVAHDGSNQGDLPFNGTITFLSDKEGWLVGSETTTTADHLYRTADGGLTWNQVDLPVPASVPGGSVNDIGLPSAYGNNQMALPVTFEQTDKGITLGGAYVSTDGGSSWRFAGGLIPEPTLPAFVSKPDSSPSFEGFAAGSSGVYVTTDGGASWKLTASDTLTEALKSGSPVGAPTFVSPDVGWLLLQPRTAGGSAQLLETHDGGQTWSAVPAKLSTK